MKRIIFLMIFILFIPINVLARNETIEVSFSRCIDGDTSEFIYNNEKIKVRYLAIDTPETKHPTKKEEPFGREASDFTCNAIENAKKIHLEFDSNSAELDRYNRYLAWVFVDDNLLQEALVKNGLAEVAYLYGDYKYTDILKANEKKAQEEQLGIWGEYISPKDYTLFYVTGIIIILIILSIVIPKIKNKEIKKLTRNINRGLNKNLSKLIKSLK